VVAGHLSVKKGYYYCVLNYKDEYGKRKNKWISTGLPEKGNKKRAEEILIEERRSFIPPRQITDASMLFADFVSKVWLPSIRNNIEITTYSSYQGIVTSRIDPYFRNSKVTLEDLKPKDIQEFYTLQSQRVKPATVKHYHAVIHEALEQAVNLEMIPYNPSERAAIPRSQQFISNFYTAEDVEKLFDCIRGDEMETLFRIACFYGLRKSEIIGLKWDAINFEDNTFVVRHTVTRTSIDGKKLIIRKDRTKRAASYRTMPLIPEFREELLAMKRQQEENKLLCGNSYNREDEEYVFVDALGNLFDPQRVYRHFKWILKKNNLKDIRFCETRQTSGSILCQNGVPMKEIQEWLGHKEFSTTANYYAHLESSTKERTARSMIDCLSFMVKKEASSCEDETSESVIEKTPTTATSL
jgi:integrase